MKIVVDTSVMYQALMSSAGASHEILQLIRRAEVQIAISVPVFEEYSDVFLRESSLASFNLKADEIHSFLDFIALVSVKTDIRFLMRPNLQDENDNIFAELAFASGANYLITRNSKDFLNNTDLILDSFQIVNPYEFLQIRR
jgi:putative PIN family toxin of toxin-antitoxin system